MNKEIITPSSIKKTDFKTGEQSSATYHFNYIICQEKLQLSCQAQIENS